MGKNLANMELQIFIATIFRRYTFVLEDPKKHVRSSYLLAHQPLLLIKFLFSAQFDTVEGFLRKPIACRVGMKRREV